MIRKKVLGIGTNSATLLVQDTDAGDSSLRVLRRLNVSAWSQRESQEALDLYVQLHGANLPGFVHLHTVLMQNSYLNMVTSYCPGGDLNTFLDDELEGPLPEKQALLWLLVMSLAVNNLHRETHLSFYGLCLDRVYLDSDRGGASGILLGLPIPPWMYFKTIAERRVSGVAVQYEYPPEVLDKKHYHATQTDVWHLGRIGMRLLTANSELKDRSLAARGLIAGMMSPDMAVRWSLGKAIDAMRSVVGDVKLPASTPRVAEQKQPSQRTPHTVVGAPPQLSSGHSAVPSLSSECSSTDVTANNSKAAGGGGGTQSSASSPPETLVTRTQRKTTTPNKLRHPHDISKNNSNSNSTSLNTSQPQLKPIAAALSTAGSKGSSSPRRTDGSGSNHNNNNNKQGVDTPSKGAVEGGAHRGQRGAAGTNSWHRRAMEQFEELQRLNASPPRNASRHGTPGRGARTPRSSRELSELISSFAEGQAEQRGQHSPQGLRKPSPNVWRGKSPPRLNSRGKPIDNNTRVLEEMFGDANSTPSHSEHTSGDRKATSRYLNDDGGMRQNEIRKHIKAWTNQRLNVEVDGVVVSAPMRRPSSPSSGSNTNNANNNNNNNNNHHHNNNNAHVPVTVAVPKRPPPPPQNDVVVPLTEVPASPRVTGGASSPHSSSYATPNRPRHAPQPQPQDVSNPSSQPSSPPRPPRSPRPADLSMSYSSGLPPVPQSRGGPGRPPSPLVRSHADPTAAHTVPQPTGGVFGYTRRSSGTLSSDQLMVSSIEWHIDGVRSALRGLLKRRTLYAETMGVVASFVSRPEEERFDPHCNEAFMLQLRDLIENKPLFMAASPLCAQLVALEALFQHLKDQVRPSNP